MIRFQEYARKSGAASTTVAPGATIAVYATGTTNLSTIYEDNGVTPKANPFVADSSSGYFMFYAANGRYDVRISGTGISQAYTWADVVLLDSVDPASSDGRYGSLEIARVYDAKAYGAAGDGVTDDTTAIQVAATAASGGILFFPPDSVYLVSTMTISANTTIEGHSATIKQKVLGAGVGSPIFDVRGADVTIRGLAFDGQRSSQPADGFSDSYDTGGGDTGRAFRAAIKADANSYTISNLKVIDCHFKNVYGACVASRGVTGQTIANCTAENCNFELGFIYAGTANPADVVISGNRMKNLGSAHATVNADAIILSSCTGASVTGNQLDGIERCFAKIENGSDITISGNSAKTNGTTTSKKYPAVQITGTGSRITVGSNLFYSFGIGAYLTGTTQTSVVITGNIFDTTNSASTPDGILFDTLDLNGLVVSGNTFRAIGRNAIGFQGAGSNFSVSNNIMVGDGDSAGIYIAFSDTIENLSITDNIITGFIASAAGDGVINFGSAAITGLVVSGNYINAGGATNRALMATAASNHLAGKISDNYIIGTVSGLQSSVVFSNNFVSGVNSWTPTYISNGLGTDPVIGVETGTVERMLGFGPSQRWEFHRANSDARYAGFRRRDFGAGSVDFFIFDGDTGSIGINQATFGASLAKGLAMGAGTAPTTSPADAAQLWVEDVNGEAGKAGLHMRGEASGTQIIPGVMIKATTGDPTYDGTLFCINTFDDTVKMYCDGGWREIATSWAP